MKIIKFKNSKIKGVFYFLIFIKISNLKLKEFILLIILINNQEEIMQEGMEKNFIYVLMEL